MWGYMKDIIIIQGVITHIVMDLIFVTPFNLKEQLIIIISVNPMWYETSHSLMEFSQRGTKKLFELV